MNGKKTSTVMALALSKAGVNETKNTFVKVADVRITVPTSWNHGTVISEFSKEFRSQAFKVDKDVTDSLISTQGFVPGRQYRMRLFSHNSASMASCLEFLESQGALLVGAHGLVAAAMLKPYELVIKTGKEVFSLAELKVLPVYEDGTPMVPIMTRGFFGLVPIDAISSEHLMLCVTTK
ncbi:MAG: hypothetical protein NTZ36_03755 [Candidatus Jorgensenbacteria bacterium]|nr:hypothetical protein [Candidatus Jorgensenbacteria bacterium]